MKDISSLFTQFSVNESSVPFAYIVPACVYYSDGWGEGQA